MSTPPTPVTEERLRDADRSQNTILIAARDEFAEHGLGGARMDRIAERAGLNKRLIYYYFEDKERLFQAVLEQAYRDIREEEQQLNLLHLKPETALRRLVEFLNVNLIRDDWPFRDPFDVVFCRNVMIYFDAATQRRVLERIHRVMKPGGLLFVGHAENFSDSRDLFTLKGKTVYERR